LSVQKQQRQLAKADIIIGTPGRLWEVMSSSPELSASFKQIKFLVIDEADRLLTEGHFKEAEEILSALDRQQALEEGEDQAASGRQTLVFSATFHKGLQQKLTGKGKQGLLDESESMEYLLKKLNFREDKPKFVDVNPISQMADKLKEGMVECTGTEKVWQVMSSEKYLLTKIGPLLIRPPLTSSKSTDSNLHKLHPFRPTSDTFASKSQPPGTCSSLSDGPKGSHAFHRALFRPGSHWFNPCRHRCRSPRSRYRRCPISSPLPSPSGSRHVCTPIWTYCSRRRFGDEHPDLRARRGGRDAASRCQSTRAKCYCWWRQ
jgi:hypothetical protein